MICFSLQWRIISRCAFSSSSSFLSVPLGNVLKPNDNGIFSSTIQVYNTTWINCDGINDYIQITPSSNDTLSFWYNDTSSVQWINVVDSMKIKILSFKQTKN